MGSISGRLSRRLGPPHTLNRRDPQRTGWRCSKFRLSTDQERNELRWPSDGKSWCGRAEVPEPGSAAHRLHYILSTDPFQHFLIRLFNPSQVLPESILIHRFFSSLVPKPAGIRRNFISQNQLAVMQAEFQFKVHQDHLAFSEEWLKQIVHFQRQPLNLRQLFG